MDRLTLTDRFGDHARITERQALQLQEIYTHAEPRDSETAQCSLGIVETTDDGYVIVPTYMGESVWIEFYHADEVDLLEMTWFTRTDFLDHLAEVLA